MTKELYPKLTQFVIKKQTIETEPSEKDEVIHEKKHDPNYVHSLICFDYVFRHLFTSSCYCVKWFLIY